MGLEILSVSLSDTLTSPFEILLRVNLKGPPLFGGGTGAACFIFWSGRGECARAAAAVLVFFV